MRLIKAILILVVLGAAGLTVYAYVGDLTPEMENVSQPVPVPGPSNGN
ncbi:MAG: hypothetical protein LPK12_13405 [Rhodobacterales bacterium]|nr:hypothetical protein [Gemmobacter nectariphilus]MDX5358722.1 hypothetical protein [Rhodobacterales bacterium]MDX5500937.1 hypothetical protein [Rhodobacterales bacterium]